jgi:hypothetical protein
MRILFALVVAGAAIWLMKLIGILDGNVLMMSIVAAGVAALAAWFVPRVPRIVVGVVGVALILVGWFVPALSEMPAALAVMAIIAAVLLGLTFTIDERAPQSRASTGH